MEFSSLCKALRKIQRIIDLYDDKSLHCKIILAITYRNHLSSILIQCYYKNKIVIDIGLLACYNVKMHL